MRAVRLTASQVRYVNKAFWRNPASAFFTFAFPLMFLVIFTALLGHGTVHLGSHTVHLSTYYVAAMAAFAVISACYNNLAITVTFQREAGILKRTNGTPLPAAAFLGARVLHALAVSVLLVVLTVAFGRLVYSADVPTGVTLLRFLVMLVVGSASFERAGLCHLGGDPERRRVSGNRECQHHAVALPLRDLHSIRQLCAGVDRVGRQDLPGAPFRHGHAVRFPRYPLQLDRRPDRRRLGARWAPPRDPSLQLGAARLIPETVGR